MLLFNQFLVSILLAIMLLLICLSALANKPSRDRFPEPRDGGPVHSLRDSQSDEQNNKKNDKKPSRDRFPNRRQGSSTW